MEVGTREQAPITPERPPATPDEGTVGSAPPWLLGLVPLVLIAVALGVFAALGGPGLGERRGPPAEELAVERTVLRPGTIELTVRNTGPDPVEVAQVFVNDAYVAFSKNNEPVGRLGAQRLALDYPWQEGQPYLVTLLTSTGATIEHEIELAVETPAAGAGFYSLMALLGIYVGVIPVALGMLFLPFLRRVREHWIRIFMAVTIGLLGFLALDASLEGLELAGGSPGAFGGPALVFIGAAVGYLVLVGIERHLGARRAAARDAGASGLQLALMVAIGIGLHNLGEGLAIGSAYASGALALGAFIGASAYNPEVSALLLGVGIGAIVQVIQQLVPTIRDRSGRALYPASIVGILVGAAILYVTGLLVTV